MFTTVSIYFLMLFIIFWSYSGYLMLLYIISTLNGKDNPGADNSTKEKLRIAIFVPYYNEENYIEQKVKNIEELIYDKAKLEVFFLNGLSTDQTGPKIDALIGNITNYHLIETKCRGKINQINYGLTKVNHHADIIVNTDVDALLEPEILIKINQAFMSDERVAVVGANISPVNCISFEEHYWRDQNLLRLIESNFYTSSIVVAPCYAFRSSLISAFPVDCIADDIYIAFKANTEGFITKYIKSAVGTEIRTPQNLEDFFRHKFRKGNAYLIELLRFLYLLPYMQPAWKVIYITKLLQLAVIPWILPFFLLSTISLILSGWGLFQVAFFGLLFLIISLMITSFLMKKTRRKYLNFNSKSGVKSITMPFIVSNLILVLIGLSYPFYKQNSSYAKIGN